MEVETRKNSLANLQQNQQDSPRSASAYVGRSSEIAAREVGVNASTVVRPTQYASETSTPLNIKRGELAVNTAYDSLTRPTATTKRQDVLAKISALSMIGQHRVSGSPGGTGQLIRVRQPFVSHSSSSAPVATQWMSQTAPGGDTTSKIRTAVGGPV